MKKIHQHFTDNEDLAKSIGYDIYQFPNKICWYPSAGFDFRHIAHFETYSNDNFNVENKPTIYLFTDHNIEGYIEQNQGNPFRSGRVLYQDKYGNKKRTLTIISSKEITLKKDFYNPFKYKGQFDTGLLFFNKDKFSGKVFFIIAELSFLHNYRRTKIEIPIFYFTYENMNFLMDFLFLYQMKVNYLIHIKDGGGSFGGSNIPMNFIYQFQDTLKITNVISDESINEKVFNYQKDIRLIEEYLMRDKKERNKMLMEIVHKTNWQHDIKSKWTEENIPLIYYGVTDFSDFKLKYVYSWKRL
jgi:hypothetical protein